MRTHNEAARLMAERALSAAGTRSASRFLENVEPEQLVRNMLGDLVPLEQLSDVLDGLAMSVQNILDGREAIEELEDLTEFEVAQAHAGSLYLALGQEITYALLLAGDPPVVRPAPPMREAPE